MPFGTGAKLHKTLPDVSTPHVPEDIAQLSMSEMPDGPSGQVLTGRGIGVEPGYAEVPDPHTIVRKPVDEIVSNSNAFQNDDHLFFAVGANEVWSIFAIIRFYSTTTADISFTWARPTGGELMGVHAGAIGVLASTVDPADPRRDGVFPQAGAGLLFDNERWFMFWGTYVGGANAGNLQLQWAQRIAEVSDTRVLANSYIIAHKIS